MTEPGPELVDAVRSVFACQAETGKAIARLAQSRGYDVRETILHQGDRATTSWLLFKGRANAVAVGQNGQVVMLGEYGPGDLLGALPGEEVSEADADVIAAEAVRALLFRAMDLLSLAERHSEVGLTLSKALVRRLRATSRRMVAQVTLSAAGRVHAELLRLARSAGGDGMTIAPPPIMTSLAAELSTSRETVSRTVSALERRGIVRRENGALIITSPARLEEMIV
ncbi:Crp/Fnr family transcriptional regulator [Pacificimonas sp. WHA3]|uniref:Crp/Fnr family transcriptional regulator n=1 Tax=Pacificimonas pallii TaxID=2827236 RepID=A0ABS6SEB6_9SPHN|nr:Crp/Fnr family transcriptional regulator [Pacificimonas pallii]MBV7256261.1 Crp/Fnr family transcriptional regulator [Pacificimonas pallii]